jgi:hypothetical protein
MSTDTQYHLIRSATQDLPDTDLSNRLAMWEQDMSIVARGGFNDVALVWTCHHCGNGPMLCAINAKCTECEHERCVACFVETTSGWMRCSFARFLVYPKDFADDTQVHDIEFECGVLGM